MADTLFTVGPVQMYPDSLEVGGQPLPYFRTKEFSQTLLACEAGLLALAGAPSSSRVAFLTCSGSGAMEAVLGQVFGAGDRLLIVDGGTFGHRFVEIAECLGLAYDAVALRPGETLKPEHLAGRDLRLYRGLAVNAHETSTGVTYDLSWLGDLCREHALLFVVDAISAFLCDEVAMARDGIDFLITSAQKALALAPGLAMVMVSPRGREVLSGRRSASYYLDLNRHLKDGERGQTPFTPAVGVVLQLEKRLEHLQAAGGVEVQVRAAAAKAAYFRGLLDGVPVRPFAERPSNALTSLRPTNGQAADEVFVRLKDSHGLVVTPNGGALAKTVFRVGHMGNLNEQDYDRLAAALKEVMR